MKHWSLVGRWASSFLASIVLMTLHLPANAQFGPPPGPQGPAREVAPIDVTGQWVSIVTEDWRFRMVTPPKNDYPGLPLNDAARAVADQWDPAQVEAAGDACKAYGAGTIMRVPTRLRIDWQDESTLRIRTDSGEQTRLLHFDGSAPAPTADKTWQGTSVAEWELHRPNFRAPPVNGTLKAVTTGMREGFLRKNGVPYSENATVTEYFDLLTQHDGSDWLVVLTIVDDPQYFTTPVITSTNFRRQSDRSGWDPSPCSAY
jgi:hypothetical protein